MLATRQNIKKYTNKKHEYNDFHQVINVVIQSIVDGRLQ